MEEKALQELERALRAASPAPWRPCGADRGGCQCGLLWSIPLDGVVATFRDNDEDGPRIDRKTMNANAALCAALVNNSPGLLSDSRALLEARKLLLEFNPRDPAVPMSVVMWWRRLTVAAGIPDAEVYATRTAAFLGEQNGKD